MMLAVVGVASFSILWYTWSSIYMPSYHTLPPSHNSLLKSDCFPPWPQLTPRAVERQCCPRSDRALPDSCCSQSSCSHKGEAKVTWLHLKQSETVPRQTHTCWHPALPTQSRTSSLLLWEIPVFKATAANILTLWPSSSFFYLKYNLHLLSALVSICAHQFWKQDPFMLCCSSSQFVHYKCGEDSHDSIREALSM